MAQLNIMDFSTGSKTMIQDNSEGLMRRNSSQIQRMNCGNRKTEKQQLLDHMGQWGYDGGCRF